MADPVIVHLDQVLVEVALVEKPLPDVVLDKSLRGRDGAPGGTEIQRAAVGPISGHRVIRSAVDGAAYASCNDADHAEAILGISVAAASDGAPVRIATTGEVTESSWAFSPGPVFVGPNGLLVQPAPVGVAFIRQIAVALSPTAVLVVSRPPIFT